MGGYVPLFASSMAANFAPLGVTHRFGDDAVDERGQHRRVAPSERGLVIPRVDSGTQI